jgi:hypothetical protein
MTQAAAMAETWFQGGAVCSPSKPYQECREITLRLPYRLKPWQIKVKADSHRFIVIAAGRRSGKTFLACDRLIDGAVKIPGLPQWYVAPTYGMAKDIAWPILKHFLAAFIQEKFVRKIYESDLKIDFINGSAIHLKGAENQDSLRGRGLGGLVGDEIESIADARATWEEVLRPSLADHNARAMMIGTPKGYNYFHTLYQNETTDPDEWKSFHIITAAAGTVPSAELERARRDMDPRVFRQEFEASFETFGGRVFADFDRKNSKHVTPAPFSYASGMEYWRAMDFGWSAPTTTLFINVDEKEDVWIFDELEARETPIDVIAKTGDKMVPGVKPMIACDAAGDSKNEAMGTSSVAELRARYGYTAVRYKTKYPGIIQDGVTQIRKWIRNGKFHVSPKCTRLISAMEMYRYPDPKGDITSELPLKDGVSDHWTDPLRDFFLVRFPVQKSSVGVA